VVGASRPPERRLVVRSAAILTPVQRFTCARPRLWHRDADTIGKEGVVSDLDEGFGPPQRGGGGGGDKSAGVGERRSGVSGDQRAGGRPPEARPAGGRPASAGARAAGASAPPGRDEHGFSPATRGRRRSLGSRLLLVLLVVLLVVVLMGVAAAATAAVRMSRVNVKGLSDAGDRMNVLVVGSDSREQLNEAQRRRLGTGSADGLRTDTILLLQIKGDSAAMLSFPRDLFVTRCDGSQGRINVAYALGGPSCLVDTVTELSGIPVSHYLEVDFLGFAQIVNAVGGVNVFLDEPMSDRDAHIDLPAGCVALNGRQALGFVRVRKVDNDLGRIARQQRFIKELAKQVAQPSTLLNPLRLFRTANAGGAALTADRGLGPVDLAKLARAGRGLGGSSLPSFAVPGTDSIIGGAAVIVPNEAEAERIFRSFRNGSVLERKRAALRPSQVEVMVLNGAGEAGLAGRAAELLTDAGFVISNVGNAPAVDRTVVRYRPERRDEANLLAGQLPGGAVLEEVSSGEPVTLVIGPDADLSTATAPLLLDEVELIAGVEYNGAGPPPADC